MCYIKACWKSKPKLESLPTHEEKLLEEPAET